jgi:hypothetical protein
MPLNKSFLHPALKRENFFHFRQAALYRRAGLFKRMSDATSRLKIVFKTINSLLIVSRVISRLSFSMFARNANK